MFPLQISVQKLHYEFIKLKLFHIDHDAYKYDMIRYYTYIRNEIKTSQ